MRWAIGFRKLNSSITDEFISNVVDLKVLFNINEIENPAKFNVII